MTRTERQLTTVLRQVADGVREETVRPLHALPTRPRGPRRAPGWVAPVCAAMAVVLVAVLAVTLARHTSIGRPAPAATPPGPPKYYADVENFGELYVRDTATGAITAHLTACGGAVGATADDGTFYAACRAKSSDLFDFTELYRFQLTTAGKISGLAPVPGGQHLDQGLAGWAIAPSPDGNLIAISSTVGQTSSPQIIVINARTGARAVWQGGLARHGAQLSIPSLSWTDSGSLVFLAQWCSPPGYSGLSCGQAAAIGQRGGHDAEALMLTPGTRGGRLDSGKVLLRQSAPYPYLAQALISPDGSTITAAVMYGALNPHDLLPSHVEIVNISTATGTQLAAPYRATVGEAVTMSGDGSGTYLLLAAGGGRSHGWVHDGQNHPIPPYNGDGQEMAW